jgi:LDH2 family malate/lactate/ureidoglycolate dehydrogenase
MTGSVSDLARYRSEDLHRFIEAVLVHTGMSDTDASIGADVLRYADLSGIDTHGIANFAWHLHYAIGLRDGTVDPRPQIEVLRDSPVAAAWDAGHGFGPVVAHRAMSAAIDKAERTGIGMVTVRGGCHFGALGYFAQMAALREMIGMVACSTPPTAVAPYGLDKVTGTNPLAVGAPTGGPFPFVLDMATTAAAGTKLVVARREGRPIPWGWAVDETGQITTDAEAASRGGLLPLGSTPEAGAHKGFGLGLVVDMLSGLLSGNGSSVFETYRPEWRQGYWMAAWRVDAFVDRDEFTSGMQELIGFVHDSRPVPGRDRLAVPGERAAASRAERTRDGVPLSPQVVAWCTELAAGVGTEFPDPLGPRSLPDGA